MHQSSDVTASGGTAAGRRLRDAWNRAAGPWNPRFRRLDSGGAEPGGSFPGGESPLSDSAAVGQNHVMSLTEAGVQPDAEDTVVAASPTRRRSVLRLALVLATLAAGALAMAGFAATRVPEFYRQRLAIEGAEDSARRLVSDVSALHASFVREGSWEAAFSEHDINAWLASDLPRNHGRLLPQAVANPRLRFTPRRVHAALRLGAGLASTVAVLVAEVQLREPNQLGIVVEDARLGSLPLPRGLVLGAIRRRFDQIGMVTAVRRLDGRTVLVVYIPSTHESGGMSHWLESLSIGEGTVAFAGHTRPGRSPLATQSDGGGS